MGNKIVYIENRDGNAHVKTDQASTLNRAYQSVHDHGLEWVPHAEHLLIPRASRGEEL